MRILKQNNSSAKDVIDFLINQSYKIMIANEMIEIDEKTDVHGLCCDLFCIKNER